MDPHKTLESEERKDVGRRDERRENCAKKRDEDVSM
jgi:hypothetical protein